MSILFQVKNLNSIGYLKKNLPEFRDYSIGAQCLTIHLIGHFFTRLRMKKQSKTMKKVQIASKLGTIIDLNDDKKRLNQFASAVENLTEPEKEQLHKLLKKMNAKGKEEEEIDFDDVASDDSDNGFSPLDVLDILQHDYEAKKLTYEEYVTNPQISFINSSTIKDLNSETFLADVKNYNKMKQKMLYFEFVFSSRIVAIVEDFKKDTSKKKQANDAIDYLKRKYDILISKTELKKLKIISARFYMFKRLSVVFDYSKYSAEELELIADALATSEKRKKFWRGTDEITTGFDSKSIVADISKVQIETKEIKEGEEPKEEPKKAKGKQIKK